MSWDVSLYRFDQVYSSVHDVPGRARPLIIGTQEQVKNAIGEVFPGTVWDEPRDWGLWGQWVSDGSSIEFDIGLDENVDGVALHVRASDAVVAGILELAAALSCQAVDLSNSEFIHPDDPARGLTAWREYRDRVVATVDAPAHGAEERG